MYLFGLNRNLRAEAGLKGIFAVNFTLFALRLVLVGNWSIFTGGRLEVVVGKRWVAVLERVLERSQLNYTITRGGF